MMEVNRNVAETVRVIRVSCFMALASEISGTRETEAAIRQADGSRMRGMAIPVSSPYVARACAVFCPCSCSCLGIRRFSTVDSKDAEIREADKGTAMERIMERAAVGDKAGFRIKRCFLL